MDWLHRIQRTCSGLVAAVLLWSAAMPAMALALNGPPGSPGSWVEVCTSRGTIMLKRVVFDGVEAATTAPEQGLASSLAQCPYCPTAGLDTGIIGTPQGWLVVASGTAVTPLASPLWLAASHRWTLPPSNGPPYLVT